MKILAGYETLPDNLMERAWLGTLPGQVFKAYRRLVLIWWAVIIVLAAIVAGGLYMYTGDPTHLSLAVPFSIWLLPLALVAVYSMNTRSVRIIHPGEDGRYILDTAAWFKNVESPFLESDTLYEQGSRVLWIIYDQENGYMPLKVWGASNTAEKVSTAEVGEIEAYTESVKQRALRKQLTLQEQVRLGILALVVTALLIGIYLMTGRLQDGDVNASPPQAAGREIRHSTEAPQIDGHRDLRA